jgi:hypothetical protein
MGLEEIDLVKSSGVQPVEYGRDDCHQILYY